MRKGTRIRPCLRQRLKGVQLLLLLLALKWRLLPLLMMRLLLLVPRTLLPSKQWLQVELGLRLLLLLLLLLQLVKGHCPVLPPLLHQLHHLHQFQKPG